MIYATHHTRGRVRVIAVDGDAQSPIEAMQGPGAWATIEQEQDGERFRYRVRCETLTDVAEAE